MTQIQTRILSEPIDLLGLRAAQPEHSPGLLQSSNSEGWDILFALPHQSRVYTHGEAALFLHDLAALPCGPVDGSTLPFTGGWLVYAGYELLEMFEPTVPAWPDQSFRLPR